MTPAIVEARWLVRLDQPTGLMVIFAGGCLFLIGAALRGLVVDYSIVQLSSDKRGVYLSQLAQLGTAIEIYAAYLIVKGRTYFVPGAEAVLALDRRSPILYLRSFVDDKTNYAELSGGYQLLDRSLEMKLSKYFSTFGPFVAIGSPKDTLPKLGAIRLLRSDADWQNEIASLMGNARTIVAAVGTTGWIKWELSEIIRKNLRKKTLFTFPVTPEKSWFSQNKEKMVQ